MSTYLEGKFYGLDTDVATLLNDVKSAIAKAIPAVAIDARNALNDHIVNDVYRQFDPKDYHRRSEDPDGPDYSLIDFDESHGILTVDVDRDSMTLLYSPQGWATQADKDWILDGDMLVERIEKAYPPYDWHGDVPGARPFFRNFTHEMIEGDRAERVLVRMMNIANGDLKVAIGGTELERDSDDWDG